MRDSGILLPISSIPSKYGIGGFSKEAYDFVDFLRESGSKYWQILPLGPTGYGDSPYQGFSTFAGNPYFIDLEALIEEGLLTEEECEVKLELDDGSIIAGYGTNPMYVDYGRIYETRFAILRKAYERSDFRDTEEYRRFHDENCSWLDDYALYMAVKNSEEGACWADWEEGIRKRTNEALDKAWKELIDEIDFYRFQQFKFMQQWTKLKAYANERGIKIIGDIPIYVAFDCSDVWANQKLFLMDENGRPTAVAGCPPDAFSATGQLWGNPLYDWDFHKNTGYDWWIRRLKHCFELYDVVRLDHFRGFDEFYAIPAKDETAEHGEWRKGPGMALFNRIRECLGDVPIIAEDLGFLTDSVLKLLWDTQFPGMKVVQFAFDPYNPNAYLPHFHKENCVVYTGTHDNDTTKSWYSTLRDDEKAFISEYLPGKVDEKTISDCLIRVAFSSVAKLCVIPMQDYLDLGSEARLNMPSSMGTNWKWRMKKGEASKELAARIARLNFIYSRTGHFPPLPEPPKVESRCGILCSECECECEGRTKGCIDIKKPFHGECEVKTCCEEKKLEYCGDCDEFPCTLLEKYACDPEHGDNGKRIEQCKKWFEERKMFFRK
ncbi:MAG: 4-alpha-glucanotransferase [Lachnospiraceae bacterium]|nr:4-alpha-glucanotransferase [Lachnospiraceae bacterium]